MDLGLDTRKEYLSRSLLAESLTSSFIGGLLGITNLNNSKTLGNKSSSLSFSQKIDLLIDMGALDYEDKNKFQTFMEIRNQFVHNIEAASYILCFRYLNGKDKFVLKQYPQPDEFPEETKLKLASLSLADDVLTLIAKIM